MPKVQIKYEQITPLGWIFFIIMEQFDVLLSKVVNFTLEERCQQFTTAIVK